MFYMIIIIFVFCWWSIIIDRCVFLPPFIQYQTRPFKQIYNSTIPSSWKPPFEIVVSFSTVPHHIYNLSETIDSLLDQSIKPDHIYLNIPTSSIRTGEKYEIPSYLNDYALSNNSMFKIIQIEKDLGPLTKLYPILNIVKNDETLIITIDDDKIYPKDLIKTISWYSYNYPFIAWSDCGWGFQYIPKWINKINVIPVYIPFVYRHSGGRYVEVLQGVCGNGYRRSFFNNLSLLSSPPEPCFTTDDLWISGYLKFNSNISRVLIKEKIEPIHTTWKLKNIQSKFDLSTFNNENNQDIKCITAIEHLFDAKWLSLINSLNVVL